MISPLRTLGLYQNNGNKDVPLLTEDVVENIIEEIHSAEVTQKIPGYNIDKLNIDILRKEQQRQVLQKQGNRNKDKARCQFHTRWTQHIKKGGKVKTYSGTHHSCT